MHAIRVHEPQHRKQCSHIKEQCGCRPTPNAPPGQPECEKGADGGHRIEPLPPRTGVGLPARVNEAEVRRPEQVAEVKPERPAGNQAALRESQGKIRSLRADMVFLQPGGYCTKTQGQGEEWQRRQHVRPPPDLSALPPANQQNGRRQRKGRRLGQQRTEKQDESQTVKK